MQQPIQHRSIWKRVGLIAAEVVLVLLTLAMLGLILLPVYKGTSPEARERDPFSTRRR
jgi:hypothetical protein